MLNAHWALARRPANEFGRLIQNATLFDRAFRFPVSGSRVRNYDALGGHLLFAYLHQARALSWIDNRLTTDWTACPTFPGPT